ncbi:LysM peptidoglycan-binding domain-containing protein [Peribacillus frigoritolerans]|nr:LysM peptidoglycan-binding domain-containing protein [Peribacillus frigoritolerans]
MNRGGKLKSKGTYSKRTTSITHGVWHHSLTKKNLAGSTAESFAVYHVNTLGWPGVGYTFIIEPKNVINTPNGKRARIVYAHDIDRRTYHVGNSNQFSLGICVAGDYRYDTLDDATLASIAELHTALVKDGIGKFDEAHNEMPGNSWKACCEYNYRDAFDWKGSKNPTKPAPAPDVYIIQEGDTLWSIAHKDGTGGVQVEDLIKANPGIVPEKLKIGQKINFGNAKDTIVQPDDTKETGTSNSGDEIIKSIQKMLNSRIKLVLLWMVNGELRRRLQLLLSRRVQKGILHGFYRQHFIWKDLILDHLILSSEKVLNQLYISSKRHGGYLRIKKQAKILSMNCLLHNKRMNKKKLRGD